jgi:hypothetical protein
VRWGRVFLLVFAGCSVPVVDLTGKSCPCAPGYTCNPTTNTCVGGLATDAQVFDAPRDGTQNASCLAGSVGALLYETTFDDFAGWNVGGGTWNASNGEVVQSNVNSDLAYAYTPSNAVSAADYRIVSTWRLINGSDGNAVELTARTQTSSLPGQYHCNWSATDGVMNLMWTVTSTTTGFMNQINIDVTQIPGYDPHAPVTMEFQVRGGRLDCCVRGVPAANLFANDTRYATGPGGMKTYHETAAYTDFHVYAVP